MKNTTQSKICKHQERIDVDLSNENFSLHANTFLEYRVELESRGLHIANVRELYFGDAPTSKIRAYFKGNIFQLKKTLREVFGTNEVLGPNHLGGPYRGPNTRGNHYKLAEYAHAGAEVNGNKVHNTIIDIYVPDEKSDNLKHFYPKNIGHIKK